MTMRTATLLNVATAPAFALAVVPHQHQPSPWHSPVPYLFGGLAAMMGLIALALLILVCSYWKLSGDMEGGNNGGEGDGDLESGDAGDAKARPQYLEERIVVIMAGDKKPTFLATPISGRVSSFGANDKSKSGGGGNKKEDEKKESDADSDAAQHRTQEESHQNQ